MLYAYNPLGIVSEAKHPAVGLALATDIVQNLDLLLSLERYKNSSRRYGYKRGDLKFWHKTRRRFIPLASTYKEMQVLGGLFGLDVAYEYQFGDVKWEHSFSPDESLKWLSK